MFWKVIALVITVWAVALYFSFTLSGLIHLLPVGALVVVIVRQMAKRPNTEFGRWKSAADRTGRR